MKSFKKVIKEINATFGILIVFDALLNSIIIFLLSFLVLSLFNFYPNYAFLPATIYLIAFILKKIIKNHLVDVEKNYINLDEKLRTAADNINKENPVVNELQSDIIKSMKYVHASSFINQRFTSYKILACIALSFTIVLLASFDVSINIDIANIAKKAPFSYKIGGKSQPGEGIGTETVVGTDANSDIYGAESVANLGNKKINIVLSPASYELNIRKVEDVQKKVFDEKAFPDEIFSIGAENNDELGKFNLKEQKIIKNYFLKGKK